MRVSLIGGTGYIGRALSSELADRGHVPVVLSRSAAASAKVDDARVQIVDGVLTDLPLLRNQAASSDAVIYLAVAGLHGITPEDTAAIDSVLEEYAGTSKTFVLTSGLAVYLGLDVPFVTPDTDTAGAAAAQRWRVDLEHRVLAAGSRDIRTIVIRPSIVYGNGTASALVLALMQHITAGNASFYIGTGANRIPTVHVADLAAVYVSALELAPAGANYNVASGWILGFDLAHATAAATGSTLDPVGLSMPEAVDALGYAGPALAMDTAVSAWALAAQLGWSGTRDSLALELAHRRISANR